MPLWEYFRRMFSDAGEPSSSRFVSFILSLADIVFLGMIVNHLCHLTDNTALGLWLTALPYIVGALVGFASLPYLVNRGTVTLTDIIASLKGKDRP